MNSGRYYLKIIKRQKKINVQTIIINILIKKRRYILFINKKTNMPSTNKRNNISDI